MEFDAKNGRVKETFGVLKGGKVKYWAGNGVYQGEGRVDSGH